MTMGRLAKLTDLFEEGVAVSLHAKDGTEVAVIWLNKLSPFESEAAAHEGRIARARLMLAIREVGTAESDLFSVMSDGLDKAAVIANLVAAKDNERTVKIIRELHSDKEWKEKLEILEWSSEQIQSLAEDDPQVTVISKTLDEYQIEIANRTEFLSNEMRNELSALTEAKVRKLHRESFAEERGIAAFLREKVKSEMFYSIRMCNATRSDDGRWQHNDLCDHHQRWLDERNEVDQLPEALLEQVQAAYGKLNMAPDVARFLEGPASSSESHGPSSKQGEPKDSGPAETSEELVGTSS